MQAKAVSITNLDIFFFFKPISLCMEFTQGLLNSTSLYSSWVNYIKSPLLLY